MSLFDLATDADSGLVAGVDLHPFQLVDDLSDDVVARKPVETQHDEMQRDAGQLIGVDAVERECLVEYRIQRLTNDTRLHLSNDNTTNTMAHCDTDAPSRT